MGADTPLTRTDVEEIVQSGGSLAGRNLSRVDLSGIHLIQVNLSGADLSRADLTDAHLFGTNLNGAILFKTNLERANLNGADLRGADLLGAILDETKLSGIILDEHCIVIQETEAAALRAAGDREACRQKLTEARDVYIALRACLTAQSLNKHVGALFGREMVVSRKLMPLFSMRRLLSKTADITAGYGERIDRIFIAISFLIVISAFVFGIEGIRYGEQIVRFGAGAFLPTLGELFYFSMVVFTTVGFGDMAPFGPLGKLTMMIEGFAGTIFMAVLIIALYKRSMAR